jgi:ketosteroid isomerase-like protein
LELQYLPGGGIVRNVALLFVAVGVLTTGVFAQLQNSSKAQDESELRRIESESAKFEQQNDSRWTDLLADDWVLLGNNKNLTKTELQANVKQNFAAHNGPNPYTIEKKNMRVDLFGDTAVVTYIKEYRQTADTTKVHDEDNTDVFTRSSKGWRVRLSKISPAPSKSN